MSAKNNWRSKTVLKFNQCELSEPGKTSSKSLTVNIVVNFEHITMQ